MNLVVNGRDAMPVGGTITIETARAALDPTRAEAVGVAAGDFVRLTVSDTGIGMDEHVLAHLFDPFFSTKAGDSGTGLGLATVYGIVRQRGGAIDVQSSPGAGARFDVYLPRVEPPPPPGPEAAARPALRGTETVLLAEDQERLRAVVGESLRELGYTVLLADGPAEALRLASEHPASIDLLLSDVIMPGMRGPELAQKVRLARPGIRILLMSGYVDDAGLHAMSGLPSAAMIAKPFTHDELAAKVRDVLRR
jgi:two-component system cell cycle sensor histidine kinase/response regulator CckA